MDATWLSKGGRDKACPLSITIGNLPRTIMNKSSAKRVRLPEFVTFHVTINVTIFIGKLVLYLPDLGGSKKNRSRVGYSEAKRVVYHQVLRRVLRSIQSSHTDGGFYATRVLWPSIFHVTLNVTLNVTFGVALNVTLGVALDVTKFGEEEADLFWPAFALVVNDNPEGQRLCGVYDHKDAKFPCRMCWYILRCAFSSI